METNNQGPAMKVYCSNCGLFMGELEGKLRPGWQIVCEECGYSKPVNKAATRSADMPEFMKQFFGKDMK